MRISCFVLKLSYFMFFLKWGCAAILDLEVKMFQNRKNNHFIGFVTPKIVEFSILYLHLCAYVLLSSKVIVFYVFQNRDRRPSSI